MRSPTDMTKMTRLAILGALAIVLSALENTLLPEVPFMPPGSKPGLSNVVTMLAACRFGPAATLYIIVIKAVFVLVTRGASAFGMSLAGGILSGIVITVMLRINSVNISYIGISVLAASAHNTAQLVISMLYTGSAVMINYLPLLLVFAVLSGIITGVLLQVLLPRIQTAADASG